MINEVSKFIVPLIDDKITESDLSEDTGFVNAYTTDKNRPYLNNHVFLLYKVVNTKSSLNTFIKFKELNSLHNIRHIVINKEHYRIYSFVVLNKDINQLKNGCLLKDNKSIVKILDFWSGKDDDLINRVLSPFQQLGKPVTATSPEEDYYPYEE
jgi:hypothetical protein